MEQCTETSAYEIQTPGNHRKERMQHSEHGESLKSRIVVATMQVHINASVFPFRITRGI